MIGSLPQPVLTRQETWLNVADSDVSGIDSSFEGDGALVKRGKPAVNDLKVRESLVKI